MNFDLSDEGRMLQDGLRRYLTGAYTPAARAEAAEHGFSAEIWAGLAEMGVIGALFPEEEGGFGGTGFDIALVFEELGRVGAVDPLIDTGILGGGVLAAAGRLDDLEAVIGGGMQLALAHGEPGSRYDLARVEATATRSDDGWALAGRKAVVVNAGRADRIVVSARTSGGRAEPAGITLFLVDPELLELAPYPLVGGGMASEIALDGVTVPGDAVLGEVGEGHAILQAVTARATLALSAEALGLMEAVRALTVDYLRTRKQFGQPIGKFQVLQHRMADVLIEIEQARSAVINLAGHIDSGDRELHLHATKNLIGEVARLVVEESIQMHGGIGVTEEYDLGRLVKRLTMVDHRFGDTLYHLERFIALRAA